MEIVPLTRSLCLSQPRRLRCWYTIVRSLSANVFVALQPAERASFCVARVIADKGIAALLVARRHARNNDARPANAINKAPPDALIIGIGNARIAAVARYGNTCQVCRLSLRHHRPLQPLPQKT